MYRQSELEKIKAEDFVLPFKGQLSEETSRTQECRPTKRGGSPDEKISPSGMKVDFQVRR